MYYNIREREREVNQMKRYEITVWNIEDVATTYCVTAKSMLSAEAKVLDELHKDTVKRIEAVEFLN